jgi:LysM repeat protein
MIKVLAIISWAYFNPTPASDSIGKEVINGKVYVLHQVGERETLYGISKRYGTTVEGILEKNPTADGGLEIGQILKVPYVSSPKKQPIGNVHIVAEKETLFSIAKLYALTVDELKNINNLSENSLSIGQSLIVTKPKTTTANSISPVEQPVLKNIKGVHTVAAKETLFSLAKQYGITVDQLKQWNSLSTTELKLGQILFVVEPAQQNTQVIIAAETEKITSPVTTPVVTQTPIKISEGYKDGKEVIESGLAELIEGTQGNRKYLGLHRSAPVGTILKLKNPMNDREVFVRIIGKLPDTGQNDKVVIKISKSAYDRLAAIDTKFMVELTWYK